MVEPLVTEAARFFEEVFAPTNAIGDDEGAQFADGSVTMPEAFEEAFEKDLEVYEILLKKFNAPLLKECMNITLYA